MSPTKRLRFEAYLANRLKPSAIALMFGMPMLLVVGWARDYISDPAFALETLPPRLGITAALLGLAALALPRRFRRWYTGIGITYGLLFGAAIAVTTINEPIRLSMLHVVVVLMLILWLRFAVTATLIIGAVTAFTFPLLVAMYALDAPPALWWAYGMYCVIGIWIGLVARNTHLEAWLELYLLRERLLERLHIDTLTGLANREAWEVGAERAHRRARATGKRYSIAFLDLDRFKEINDRHGHAAGDHLLQKVAEVLQRHLHDGEVVARIGGEEFVALLPGMGIVDAYGIAERIRHEVESMRGDIAVTLSVGVAEVIPGESLESTTERADAAMLEAKRAGRNNVRLSTGPTAQTPSRQRSTPSLDDAAIH